MHIPHLKENPTLSDIQSYVAEACRQRGFDKETIPEKLMLLLEECGELAKAIRKTTGVKTDPASQKYRVDHEAVDVLWLLLFICDHYGIDLEKALREKEAANAQRVWKTEHEKTAA